MAQFIFTGDPNAPGSDPKSIDAHGLTFPKGQAVEVQDEAAAAKLRTHSHFTEAGAKAEKPKADDKPGVKAKADKPAEA